MNQQANTLSDFNRIIAEQDKAFEALTDQIKQLPEDLQFAIEAEWLETVEQLAKPKLPTAPPPNWSLRA
jgi:uncharacterized coiled-coil protein SlyX